MIVKSELFRNEEFNQAIQLGNTLNADIVETEIEELKEPHIIKTHPTVGITANVYYTQN